MTLLYGSTLPDSRAEGFDARVQRETAEATAAQDLWNATRDLGLYRDNANNEENAFAEAYERRNRAIFEATGVQLGNPIGWEHDSFNAWRNRTDIGFSPLEYERRNSDQGPRLYGEYQRRKWLNDVQRLEREYPQAAKIIAAGRPIEEDAFSITRGAEAEFERANAASAGLSTTRRVLNTLGGGFAGALRDPMQIGTLFLGGGPSSGAKLVTSRILSTVFREAAVNAGAEALLQFSADDYRARAGVEHGFDRAAEEVGIAALLGGAFGGVLSGGAEVFRVLGRRPPPGVLERIAAGEAEPGDVHAIAAALDVELDADMSRAVDLAIEQGILDREAFGPPPAGVAPAEAEAAATAAIRAIEDDVAPHPVEIGRDMQAAAEQVERAVRARGALGKAPRQPVSLMRFLAGRNVRGIRDESGELAAMGLTGRFVPGAGRLVRASGKSLDYAREAAAEAGYFDHLYGSPDEAMARSTPADLLNLLSDEAGGKPAYRSIDQGMLAAREHYEQALVQREKYRDMVATVESAAAKAGHKLDDAVLIRATEFYEAGDDLDGALERALDEDYRMHADRDSGEEPDDGLDIPFFDEENPGAMPGGGGAAGEMGGEGFPGGSGGAAQDGWRLSGASGREGEPPVEPGTPQAAEAAAEILNEARQGVSEATAAGEQVLIPGVKPVTTREKLQAEGAKPMRGGDAPPPEGGLFDETARNQVDLWDTLPAGKDAEGNVIHTTHAELIEDADRSEFYADFIKSCRAE